MKHLTSNYADSYMVKHEVIPLGSLIVSLEVSPSKMISNLLLRSFSFLTHTPSFGISGVFLMSLTLFYSQYISDALNYFMTDHSDGVEI